MANQPDTRPEETGPVPLAQRLYDSPFLLLAAGILVVALFYTAWGLYEILTLTPAPLP